MGYQFTNNWPYTYTLFPTMVDHTDPVNETYFDGLHTEIENIEDELGLNPSGDQNTVDERITTQKEDLQTNIDAINTELGDNPSGGYDTVEDRFDALPSPSDVQPKQIITTELAADVTLTSINMTKIAAMDTAITTGANKLLIILTSTIEASTTVDRKTAGGRVRLKIDSTDLAGTSFHQEDNAVEFKNLRDNACITQLVDVSAAAHNVYVYWGAQATNVKLDCKPNTLPEYFHMHLTLIELHIPA